MAPLLDWSDALRIYDQVEAWSRAGSVTADEQTPSSLPVADATALCVTLRWRGMTLANAQASIFDDTPDRAQPKPDPALRNDLKPSQPTDLMTLAARATRMAINEANDTLITSHDRALLEGYRVADDRLPCIEALTPPIQVDLQIAHASGVIHTAGTSQKESFVDRYARGYHGLRLVSPPTHHHVHADQSWSWPVHALTANLTPASQLTQMCAKVGLPTIDLSLAISTPGTRIERFDVIHLVRPAPDQPVLRLIRGNHLLPPVSLSGRSVDAVGDRIAAHLVRRLRNDGELAGTYLPSEDRYDPAVAPIEEAALAAYALAKRAAHLAETSSPQDHDTAAVVRRLVDRLIVRLDRSQTDRSPQADAATRALVLMTLVQDPTLVDLRDTRDKLIPQLLKLRRDDGSFAAVTTPHLEPWPHPVQALILAALACAHEQTRDPALATTVTASVDRLATQLDTKDWIATIPWLPYAQLIMERSMAPDSPGRRRLHTLRRHQWPVALADLDRRQITSAPRFGPADVVGGIDLASSSGSPPAAADWHTTRALVFMALAAHHPTARPPVVDDPASRPITRATERLLDCGLAARFIAQLTFDEVNRFYLRSHADVIGGVRLSLWDNRLTVAASAMALLGVTELQHALAEISLKALEPGER